MGVIVDSVSEVLNIAADEIEETPDFGDHVDTDYMRGVAKVKGTVKILLDLDRVFAVDAADGRPGGVRRPGRWRPLASGRPTLARAGSAGSPTAICRRSCRLVYEKSGITLHDGKRPLVVARLQKRLRAGGFASFARLSSATSRPTLSGDELTALLDAIATNHTSFFREPQHFDFLASRVVPEWLARRDGTPMTGWSAACSTGEEPYSIAMTLLECVPLGDHGRRADRAPAICRPRRCATARRRRSTSWSASRTSRGRCCGSTSSAAWATRTGWRGCGAAVRGAGRRSGVQNLLEIESLGRTLRLHLLPQRDDLLRPPVQQRVVSMLERHLAPGGYLFISHSESLNGVRHGLRVGGAGDLSEEAARDRDGRADRARPVVARGSRRRACVVGIGELAVETDRAGVIVTHALGSCIAVCLFDPRGARRRAAALPAAGLAASTRSGRGRSRRLRRHRHSAAVPDGLRAGPRARTSLHRQAGRRRGGRRASGTRVARRRQAQRARRARICCGATACSCKAEALGGIGRADGDAVPRRRAARDHQRPGPVGTL